MIILFLKKYQATNYFLLETINQLTKPLHFKCYNWHPIRKVHYSRGKARDEVSSTIYNISCWKRTDLGKQNMTGHKEAADTGSSAWLRVPRPRAPGPPDCTAGCLVGFTPSLTEVYGFLSSGQWKCAFNNIKLHAKDRWGNSSCLNLSSTTSAQSSGDHSST